MIKTIKKMASRVVKQVKSLVKKVVGYFAKAFVKEEPASIKSSVTTCKAEAQSTAVKESNKEAAEEVVVEEVTTAEEATVEQQETVVTTSTVSVVVAAVKEVQVTKLISTELVINDTYLLAGLLSRAPPISHPWYNIKETRK
jgi:hypothetical protein